MVRKAVLLGLAAVVGSAAAGSVTLTDSNFETEVFASGKNAFIKFQAPWCATSRGALGATRATCRTACEELAVLACGACAGRL